MGVEKGTKEGEALQALIEKHSQFIAECQLKLKSLVIEAGELKLVEKKKLAITSFLELVHNISEEFFTYDDRKDTDVPLCSINVIKLYSNNVAVHINASKEIILREYKNKYKLEEMSRARVTRPLTAANSAPPPYDHLAPSENSGERNRRLLNERAASAASTDDNRMVVSKTDPLNQSHYPSPTLL